MGKAWISCVLLLGGLTACTPHVTTSPGFGRFVADNERLEIATPAPNATLAPAPEGDGQRAAGAVQRYYDEKTYRPVRPTTSGLSGGGGQ